MHNPNEQPFNENNQHIKLHYTYAHCEKIPSKEKELKDNLNKITTTNKLADNDKTITYSDDEVTEHVTKLMNTIIEKKRKSDPNFDEHLQTIKDSLRILCDDYNNAKEEARQKEIDRINKEKEKANKKKKVNPNLFNVLRFFISKSDFIPAFVWFMENGYEQVTFYRQHKRRIYQIYKGLVKDGGNLYASCSNDEETGECMFFMRGSKKAIRQFENNKKDKFAKILAKYIIASNTVPYLIELMSNDSGIMPFNKALPTSISTVRTIDESELYVRALEKVCFGRDFIQ